MPDMPSRAEVIALVAMLSATIAFSIDGMLPALPQITQELSPDAPNMAQLIIISFVFGMGLGTFFSGPLSDAFGRKPVAIGGSIVFILAALAATRAPDLETLLLARLVQGVGAAGPRIAAMAIIRDLYSGRAMAQTISFVMMVFTIVPALAPSLGAVLIALSDWRAVFWGFIVFSAGSALWLAVRLPETLVPDNRRPFRWALIRGALTELYSYPMIRLSVYVQSLCFAALFAMISVVQPIYESFGHGHAFHLWFGAVALLAATGSIVNARLVMRLGMRKLVTRMLMAQVWLSAAMLAASVAGLPGYTLFGIFVAWQVAVFFQAGLTLGNLNALAMEPVGHIAGLAASIISSLATVFAVLLVLPLSYLFDGTPVYLATAILVYAAVGVVLMRKMARLERIKASQDAV